MYICRLWKDCTKSLKEKDVEKATEAKHFLEQRQREEAKDRKERGVKWDTRVSLKIRQEGKGGRRGLSRGILR